MLGRLWDQPTSESVTATSIKTGIKLGLARVPQPTARARRDEAWRGEAGDVGGGVREGYSSCHTRVSGATLYYIRWSNTPSTSNVGLNFSTTSTAICCHIQVGQREFQNLSNGPTTQTHQIPTKSP